MYIRLFKRKELVCVYESPVIPRVGELITLDYEEVPFKVLAVNHIIKEREVYSIDCHVE